MIPHCYQTDAAYWLPAATRRGQLVDDFCREHGCTALDVWCLITRLEDAKREGAVEELERKAIHADL
jgi:hypothetical protein